MHVLGVFIESTFCPLFCRLTKMSIRTRASGGVACRIFFAIFVVPLSRTSLAIVELQEAYPFWRLVMESTIGLSRLPFVSYPCHRKYPLVDVQIK